ncbi:MAG: PAQR family membrane homeostasis protein TrhA [Actinomycetaceae bacterium]
MSTAEGAPAPVEPGGRPAPVPDDALAGPGGRPVTVPDDAPAGTDDGRVVVVKPRARGWIHLATTPVALVVGLALVAFAPTLTGRVSNAIFTLCAVLLFGTSAVYHRGVWEPKVERLLRRLDHTNIFLLIAGTYTPLATLLLPGRAATMLLAVVWGGALLGTLGRMFWLSAPRWVYTPVYIALGWVAVWFLPDFWQSGHPAVVWLVIAGGLAYTLGASAYALKRPNPVPGTFGFHEIFHVGTVVGWACHAGAIAVASAGAA